VFVRVLVCVCLRVRVCVCSVQWCLRLRDMCCVYVMDEGLTLIESHDIVY